MLDLVKAAKHRLIGEVIELFAAQIVIASFHITDIELAFAVRKKCQLKKRDIFMKELLLKIFCACRNDDSLARTNNGYKVSQRFAGPGACLDNQVTLFFKRLLHRFCHLQLSPAELVCGMGA